MKLRTAVKCTISCLVGIAPTFSRASIPLSYFPSYYVKTSPVSEKTTLTLSQNKTVPAKTVKHKRLIASINSAALMISTPSKVFYGEDGKSLSPELIANFNQIKAHDKPLDVSQLIPMDMEPTDNSGRVFSQVADRSLSTFFNSQAVRESAVGQTATSVEKKMKKEVVIGSGDSHSTQHKFNFNLQAFQALAQIQYTGFTNAALKYKIAENKLALEVFEKISSHQDLVVSHTMSTSDQLSQVSMRWSF